MRSDLMATFSKQRFLTVGHDGSFWICGSLISGPLFAKVVPFLS